MPQKIFISYRREDSAANALGIGQYLEHEFGRKNVFLDIDMRAGTKFPIMLEQRLAECKVMIVLIGPNWLNSRDGQGQLRLDNPDDWVRLEIGHALKRNITVIPVRVNGVDLPPKTTLPEEIRGLLDHQAISVSTPSFRSDMAGLAKDIRSIPTPWPWRRFASIAGGLLLLLVAGLVLGHTLGFINVVERIRTALWSQTSGSAKQEVIWNSRPGEWVLFGYSNTWIGFFFQPSTVKTFPDTVLYTARFPTPSTNTTAPSKNPLPQPVYEDDKTLIHCKKPLSAVIERTVYNQSGETISHYKRGDPESFDLSTGGAPISPGSIIASAQSIMCDKQIWRTPLLKQQPSEMKYLSSAPSNDGDIYYGPIKTVSNSDYQFELLSFLKYYQDHQFSEMLSGNNIIGLQPTFRVLAQTLQINCQQRKMQAPRIEYYDAEVNLLSIVVPIPFSPLASPPPRHLSFCLTPSVARTWREPMKE